MLAADIELLKDINQLPLNLEGFSSIASVGASAYFAASDGTHGVELWRTDGTPSGTFPVKDINPGAQHSRPGELTRIGNTVYFAATNATTGRELWKTDGTSAGTQLVADLWPGTNSSNPNSLFGFEGKLYFFAAGRDFLGLYESDGTSQGTKPVTGLLPEGWAPADQSPHAVFQDQLYLTLAHDQDGVRSYALFRTDGTPGGSQIVANDLRMDPGMSAELNATLFVANNVGDSAGELWKTDGSGGFVKVSTGHSFGVVSNMVAANGRLYFVAGGQLWVSDGTDAGTALLADSISGADLLTPVGGMVFFSRQLPETGDELWVTDGTQVGTHLVKDIVEGPTDSVTGLRFAVGNTLRFAALEDGSYRLWSSDGTALGTQPLKTLAVVETGIGRATMLKSGVALFVMGVPGRGDELWASDGTGDGTIPMTAQLPMTKGANPSAFIQAANQYFFTADDGVHGRELWVTDGTPDGTHLVKDILPGLGNGMGAGVRFSDMEAAAVGSTLFFIGNDGEHGRELWKTDGTEAGTSIVKDIWQGPSNAFPTLSFRSQLLNFNGVLLFSAQDSDGHRMLWRTDGTEAGTSIVSDKFSGSWMHIVGNQVYLQALTNTSESPSGIYRTDGTPEGTIYVSDGVNAGITYPARLGSTLLFGSGELWKTDGTPAGTVLVKDIFPGDTDSKPEFLVSWQGSIYFLARAPEGDGLWKTDGTAAGTVLVKLLPQQVDGLRPHSLQAAGDYLYFYHDFKIWRSDGTEFGTKVFSENGIVLGSQLASQNGQIYWVVDLGGQQGLWTGGTAGGQDLGLPGALSELSVLGATDTKVFFAATGSVGSGEIWVGRLTSPVAGDANGDGKVDLTDFAILKNNFGTGTKQAEGDFNGDGRVDLTDFGIFKESIAVAGAGPSDRHNAAIDQAIAALSLAMNSEQEDK